MTFSRLERITITFTLIIIAFLAGWFLCLRHEASLVFTPPAAETITAAPGVSLPPEDTQTSVPAGKPININTADAPTLQLLPGIGEKRAADIIAYREANGPFAIPEAITDVPGIGTSILEEIIDLITVED